MEDEESTDYGGTESTGGPGREYDLYLKNEEVLDKLKLLNYEEGFLSMQYRPIQRHYFVKVGNVGEQFYLFTSLAAWLIRKCGKENYEMPQEFDDPNSTIANILNELRNLGGAVDFSANKLKQGAGEPALHVLDSLSDYALVNTGFQWQKMIPPKEEDEDVDVDQDEDAESVNQDSDDPDWADDEDDAILVDLAAPTTQNTDQPLQTILHSTTDAASWKQEVDRVTPLLKITIRQDAKDWRMHLEQMNTMYKTMSELIEETNPQLGSIITDLEKSLERVETREKSLNQQMSLLLSKFREGQDQRAETKEKYKSASGGVVQRTEQLQQLSDDIDQLKQQIEDLSSKNTNEAPMMRIKQALIKIEKDIEVLNVQIGVLENVVLNTLLSDRRDMAELGIGMHSRNHRL